MEGKELIEHIRNAYIPITPKSVKSDVYSDEERNKSTFVDSVMQGIPILTDEQRQERARHAVSQYRNAYTSTKRTDTY